MEEKKTKRSQVKYSGLDPSVNLKIRYELIADYDYLDKLSDKEKAWLNKFTKEYVNAELDTSNKRKNLHKTDKLRKDCYDRNNARNRCVLSRARASGALIHELSSAIVPVSYEESLNTKLDFSKNKKTKRSY